MHFRWRTKFLAASSEFTLATADVAGTSFREVNEMLTKLSSAIPEPDQPLFATLCPLCQSLAGLCEWVSARANSAADADRHRTAALTAAAVAQEALGKATVPDFCTAATRALQAISAVVSVTDVGPALKSAASVPVPPCLLEHRIATVPGSEIPAKPAPKAVPTGPFAIRVMLTLDGKPWANPQMLHPGTVYDVDVTATVPAWPEGFDRLVLDFVTTLPLGLCRVSEFAFDRLETDPGQELRARGQIEFQSSQSFLSEPALLNMRATFRSGADPKAVRPATVIGYHKLRARIVEPKQSPHLSKYRALDLRLVGIIDEVRELPGLDPQHLEDFITILAAVANYVGLCAQTAVYRSGEKISEDDFQRRLLIHLRGQLGEDVQEAPKQGGGITDIKFKSVTVELKVETAVADRGKIVAAYENQTTQYGSSTGAQLGVLCVLDVTEKDAPPAPTQNNLIVMTPKLHGFGEKQPAFPVRIVAAIIDGNLRSPSSYSR